MRQTLSEIKEQVRKQIAVSDKLVYLEKAPNGKVIEIHLLEWHTDESLDTWKKQAEINKQEYEAFVKAEQAKQSEQLKNQFIDLSLALVEAQRKLERLEMEIKLIKGEITEEEYDEFIVGGEEE